jgi:ribonuclease-3
VRIEGPAHEREFFVVVEIGSEVLAEGHGRSKKLAEIDAARAALLNPWSPDASRTAPLSSADEMVDPPKDVEAS